MVPNVNSHTSSMKIGLFFSNFTGGGIQRVMLTLAKGFQEENHEIHIIILEAEGALKEDVPKGCKTINLKTGQVRKSIFALISYLNTEEPDVLLSAQTHFNFVAILAKLFSKWKGKLVLSEHITIGYMTNNWKEKLFPLVARLSYRLADRVILVSDGAASHFLERTHLPASLIQRIYNPFDIEKITSLAEGTPQHPWFLSSDSPIFLSAGRLTRQKDFPTLLKAFQLVYTQRPDTRLVILGEGEDRNELEKLAEELEIQNAIDLPGFAKNPFAMIAKADAFILSSRWEGFGNVIVEALACGTPVISTDCPSGPAEILGNGKYGILVPVGDAQLLAQTMLKEVSTPTPRNMLQDRAKDFSIQKIVPEYLETFHSIGAGEV